MVQAGSDSDGITLTMLMQHQQAMRAELLNHQKAMQIQMNDRFAQQEQRTDRLERNLTRQIDAIDQRLDAVEIEMLPKRVTKLEKAVFAQAA